MFPAIDPSKPVPTSQVTDLEIVVAEKPLPDKKHTEAEVYIILYNDGGDMVASNGALALTYGGDGVSPATKTLQLQPGQFSEQIIPGEDEKNLTARIDTLTGEIGKTLTVTALFDGRVSGDGDLEFGSSIEEDEEEPDGSE